MSAARSPWAGHASARARLLEAAISTVSRLGYEAVGVEMIAGVAGVSEREFERHFSDREDCFRHAFEEVCDHFDRYMLPLYAGSEPAQGKLRRAAYGCAEYCRVYEQRVRYGLMVRSRFGSAWRAERSLRFHVEQVDSLRDVDPTRRVPPFAAELCVGSVLALLVRLEASDRLHRLDESIPALLFNAFTIFLGRNTAETILRDEELAELSRLPVDQVSLNHSKY